VTASGSRNDGSAGAQRKALGHQQAAAVATASEAQLVAARQCGGEKHGVLERDLRRGQQQPIGLERLAQQLPRVSPGSAPGVSVESAAGTTPSSDSTLASTAVSCCRRSERVKYATWCGDLPR